MVNKVFLTHALMCTREFYKFLSELGTCINILEFWAGKWLSTEDPFIAPFTSHLCLKMLRGWSLVMRSYVSTKCSHISQPSFVSWLLSTSVLPKITWPSPPSHQSTLVRADLVMALLKSGKQISLFSVRNWSKARSLISIISKWKQSSMKDDLSW